jgi:hypothetical protein
MRRPPDSPTVASSGEVRRDTLPIASAPATKAARCVYTHSLIGADLADRALATSNFAGTEF